LLDDLVRILAGVGEKRDDRVAVAADGIRSVAVRDEPALPVADEAKARHLHKRELSDRLDLLLIPRVGDLADAARPRLSP
jgi:hypothetical protein